jgi:hypothetical protein
VVLCGGQLFLTTGLDGTTIKLAEARHNLLRFKCPQHEIFYARIHHSINQMANRKTSPEAIHDPSRSHLKPQLTDWLPRMWSFSIFLGSSVPMVGYLQLSHNLSLPHALQIIFPFSSHDVMLHKLNYQKCCSINHKYAASRLEPSKGCSWLKLLQ